MKKDIIYGDEARQKLRAGVDKIARAVVTTLGPKGRNVSFNTMIGRPKVVHDGVTVAKEVELKDTFEDMGAQLVREAAEKTNDSAGDGTTTSMLLAQAIVSEGLRNVSAGANPMALKRGLEEATDKIVLEIERMAKDVSGKEEKTQVATIAAQDPHIGELIAEAMEQVGDDGVVTIEEGKGFDVELEYKEGVQLSRGYASPRFVTNLEKMECVIERPTILFVNEDINDVRMLIVALDALVKASKNIVIIADDFNDSVLATLIINKLNGVVNALAVKAPGVTVRRAEMMEDMATLTGGTVIGEDFGTNLESATVDVLGHAEKVIATKDETIIIGGKGDKKDIDERIAHIKARVENSPTDFDKEKLKERLAMISGGVAVLNVGAATESEMKEKKLRVEDAVNATKAAVEEGVVDGAGMALLKARNVLDGSTDLGYQIIFEALKKPAQKIIENAGLDPGEVLTALPDDQTGFDVMAMKYVNLLEAGIIDPAKVVRCALQNAVSVATMVLTTDCLITETEEERKEKPKIPRYGAGTV